MPKMILVEEFHVSLYVPAKIPDGAVRAIRRTLRPTRFENRLADAVRALLQRHPPLKKIKLRISR